MVDANEPMVKDIVSSIRKLVRATHLDSSEMKKRYGLTGPQCAVLRILNNEGAMSSVDLSRKLFVTPSNITGIIDRLEKKNMVERIKRPHDRRITLISLTDKGTEISQKIPDPIESRLIDELGKLNKDEIEEILEALKLTLSMINVKSRDKNENSQNNPNG